MRHSPRRGILLVNDGIVFVVDKYNAEVVTREALL